MMLHFPTRPRKAFTILEVVIALAMFALIAVPALGLAIMATKRNAESLAAADASELKTRIDVALRSQIEKNKAEGKPTFFNANLSSGPLIFVATQDLLNIEPEATTTIPLATRYFKVEIEDAIVDSSIAAPFDHSQSSHDLYRLVYYRITWPHGAASTAQKHQLFATSIFIR